MDFGLAYSVKLNVIYNFCHSIDFNRNLSVRYWKNWKVVKRRNYLIEGLNGVFGNRYLSEF